MTKPKPPRILDYDPEDGYVVAGTHDVDLAARMLQDRDEDLSEFERYEYGTFDPASLKAPECGWYRCSIASVDGQRERAWYLEPVEPHARGAFRAVYWRRPW